MDPVGHKLLQIAKSELGYRGKASGYTSWFQKHHAWGHKPEPGAIVFFSFSGGRSIGDIEHVGIVETVHGDITAAQLDDADAGTAVMPALTAAAAVLAEDREFWDKISVLEDDEELAFWDSLHSVVAGAERASMVGI
jgi:hypothetical protein